MRFSQEPLDFCMKIQDHIWKKVAGLVHANAKVKLMKTGLSTLKSCRVSSKSWKSGIWKGHGNKIDMKKITKISP